MPSQPSRPIKGFRSEFFELKGVRLHHRIGGDPNGPPARRPVAQFPGDRSRMAQGGAGAGGRLSLDARARHAGLRRQRQAGGNERL